MNQSEFGLGPFMVMELNTHIFFWLKNTHILYYIIFNPSARADVELILYTCKYGYMSV